MSDIPEPAKKIQRMMMVVIIAGAFAALAYASATWLSPDEEKACPEGRELARTNPPGETPRFECKPSAGENVE